MSVGLNCLSDCPQSIASSVDAVRLGQRQRELAILRESLLLEMGVERLAESLQRFSDDIDRVLAKDTPLGQRTSHDQSEDAS